MRIIEEANIITQYIRDNISKYTINDENNTLVINASEIFGKNNVLLSCVTFTKEINGKRVTVKIERS
jgi:hypothetical protein